MTKIEFTLKFWTSHAIWDSRINSIQFQNLNKTKGVKLLFFTLFILLFIPSKLRCQNLYNHYIQLINDNLTANVSAKIDSLIEKAIQENKYEEASKIAHEFSLKHYKNKEISEAIEYCEKEKQIFELNNIINKGYIKCLYNLGYFHFENSSFDEALNYYLKIIRLEIDPYNSARSYCEIGRILNRKGDYFKAISHYQKGIQLLEKQDEKEILISKYINFALVYFNLGTDDALEKYLSLLNKANSLISKNTKHQRIIRLYNLYASYYLEKKYNFNKASFFYHKNIQLSTKEKDTLLLGETYNNLAYLHIKTQNDSAPYYLDNGLKLIKKGIFKARLLDNYSEYYLIKNKHQDALTFINKAIIANLNSDSSIDVDNLKKVHLFKSNDLQHLLYCLNKKTEILIKVHKENHENNVLELALKTTKYATDLIDLLQKNSEDHKTKLHWRKIASDIFENGGYISSLLNDNKSFFFFIEKNKARLLTESIINYSSFSYLPKNISDTETELMKKIYSLEYSLEKTDEKTKKDLILDSIFQAKKKYTTFIDSIKPHFQPHFNNQLQFELTSINKVKKELNSNQILISYLWCANQQKILAQLISKHKTFLLSLDISESLIKNIDKYRIALNSPLTTNTEVTEYKKTANYLFNTLFPSSEIKDFILKKELIIIPDDLLQNIPFEAFITNQNEYLIQSSQIAYTYSMSFLKYNNLIKRKTTSDFSGYAPIYFKNNSFAPLHYTEKEVTSIQKIIGGKKFFKNQVTKQNFLNSSSTTKIIHLATHANIYDTPKINFYKDSLLLYELYTHKINADLVTLSACQTSLGENMKGEGVFSLARGFFISGTKSVISSFWKINDKSTSFLMKDFYTNLKKGQTKSEALATAKRNYLKKHSLSEASPYYWASFILIGDEGKTFNNNQAIYIIISVFLFILIFFFKKKGNVFFSKRTIE